MERRGNNNNDHKNESIKGKQFFAVRTCGLPQIEPDLMYNMTVIICLMKVIRLIIITIITITIITNHHHHRDHEQVKPGERVVFNCKVDLSCMVSTIRWWAWRLLWFLGMIILVGGWLLRVLITSEVFITVWCCNCSSLRSLTSYISWSATLSHSTSKHILTTFKHLWRLMYLISSL